MRCRICDFDGVSEAFRIREMMFGTGESFDYFQCGQCGCLQIRDFPEDLGKYYPPSYYSLANAKRWQPAAPYAYLQRQSAKSRLFGRTQLVDRILSKIVKPLEDELNECGPVIKRAAITDLHARILDVGCGAASWWLSALQALGFDDLLGVDPFIEADREVEGIPIRRSKIQDISGMFSLITLHHSFEHMPDPYPTLQAIRERLEPEGVCLIRLPLVSSYVWEKYGAQWVELDPPRHLFLHTANSMHLMAKRAGLEIFDTVYDATVLEFFGSEQNLQGIPYMSPQSHAINPSKSIFSSADIEAFEAEVARVNREQKGGRAGFYLRRT